MPLATQLYENMLKPRSIGGTRRLVPTSWSPSIGQTLTRGLDRYVGRIVRGRPLRGVWRPHWRASSCSRRWGVRPRRRTIIERPPELLGLWIASIVLYVFSPETDLSRIYIAIAYYSVPSVRLRTAFTETG